MNRRSLFDLSLVGIVLALVAGCSRQDRVVNVDADDPEMTAAIAKARETLPHFWAVFANPTRGETNFSLKVKITDKQGTEHFWATDIEARDGKTVGTISNEPNVVRRVKLGDRIDIPQADISDWLYLREGKMIGNYTVKALFKQMPADEVERLKAVMGEP